MRTVTTKSDNQYTYGAPKRLNMKRLKLVLKENHAYTFNEMYSVCGLRKNTFKKLLKKHSIVLKED